MLVRGADRRFTKPILPPWIRALLISCDKHASRPHCLRAQPRGGEALCSAAGIILAASYAGKVGD